MSETTLNSLDIAEENSPLVAPFPDSGDLQVLETQEPPAAINDAGAYDASDNRQSARSDANAPSGADTCTAENFNQTVVAGVEYAQNAVDAEASSDTSVADDSSRISTHSASDTRIQSAADDMVGADADNAVADNGIESTHEMDGKTGTGTHRVHDPSIVSAQSTSSAMQSLESRLTDEQSAHEETAKHLRITRKALATLEADSRDFESAKADSLIGLEEKLAQSINLQTTYEAAAAREKNRRVASENSIVKLKQDLVSAKQEIRRSTAARAKALSTANKSIAFARQSVQTRARIEAELDLARDTLKNRQATISSLIRELEREKHRTQDEIATMARQLVLHEKQIKARRTLEDVARSVENKLSSRLVKKVAKARPLIRDL
jgi:hypothetical protein